MPKISVIIPTYHGASFLGQTIESVLAQTHLNFELIIVDDASPDQTSDVVRQFTDVRIQYIRHEQNRGANQAWMTGLYAAQGEFIACLDQDDLFHPNKLAEHIKLFRERPELGVTYNSRFELHFPSNIVRGIWQPPTSVTLTDLLLGYPFAPSDMILRRKWALLKDLWDESYATRGQEMIVNGSEYVYCGRLYFAGCQFAGIKRALNYRRYHAGRVLSNLDLRCGSELRCQAMVFEDPRCPAEVRVVQPQAYMNTYLSFASLAFHQHDLTLGYEYLRKASECKPEMGKGRPAPLLRHLIARTIPDDRHDMEAMLRSMFSSLPADLAYLRDQQDWAIGRSHLAQGMKALMWGQANEGRQLLAHARSFHAQFDEQLIGELAHQLVNYEHEFGRQAAETVLRQWTTHLSPITTERTISQLIGRYQAARAFQHFREGDYSSVPSSVLRAMWYDSRYLLNRGMMSIMARSVFSSPTRRLLSLLPLTSLEIPLVQLARDLSII
jgi:glycosyltransferase involved in cell wall biosynthesis